MLQLQHKTSLPFLRNSFWGGGGGGANPNIFIKNRDVKVCQKPEERVFNDFKLTLTSDKPDESWLFLLQDPHSLGGFEFQKSRMAISCHLRVIFKQKATKNCVIGGKITP